jgi:long-chain acyl-CoA synthetase
MNEKLEHHEQVAKIIVLKDEWTLENGILTPTLKIKRKVVDELFQQQYEEWYHSRSAVSII